MKRTTLYSIFVLAAAILISGVMISVTFMQTSVSAADAKSSQQEGYRYVLKTKENQIAVYEIGEDIPIQLLDVIPSTLPYLEQAALDSGIYVETEEELKKLIEDFQG